MFLQRVGADLVQQPDAATFLAQVEDDAAAFLGDRLHGAAQLRAAVAVAAAERVAGEALRMHAGEHGRRGVDVAKAQRGVLESGREILEPVHLEIAVGGVELAGSAFEGVGHAGLLLRPDFSSTGNLPRLRGRVTVPRCPSLHPERVLLDPMLPGSSGPPGCARCSTISSRHRSPRPPGMRQ